MKQSDFVTIYTSFNDLEAVQITFPLVLAETKRANAALVVHDCSTKDIEKTWKFYQDMTTDYHFLYLFSNRIPFAVSRNMCMSLAVEYFAPQYLCMLEDDHGYLEGAIDALCLAMNTYYGKRSPNGLKYGLFSLCPDHWGNTFRRSCLEDGNGNLYPSPDNPPRFLGGANACCRCAPTSHWLSILKGHDVDEYPISSYQTSQINARNYNRGFTTLYVGEGRLIKIHPRPGLGANTLGTVFSHKFTLSDARSGIKKHE